MEKRERLGKCYKVASAKAMEYFLQDFCYFSGKLYFTLENVPKQNCKICFKSKKNTIWITIAASGSGIFGVLVKPAFSDFFWKHKSTLPFQPSHLSIH